MAYVHTVADPGFYTHFWRKSRFFGDLLPDSFHCMHQLRGMMWVLHLSAGIPVPVVVVSLAVRSDEYGVRNSNGSLV